MGRSAWTGWGIVLGFALGGFFDGILLHQILQWHHLLSLVPDAGDLRWQVLWDGLFHAAMYAIALIGLWGLWRAHRRGAPGSGRLVAGALLVGFGLWNVVDLVLAHWVLGLHRVKLDTASPLAWDLGWFVLFGLVPLGAGFWLIRGGRATPTMPARAAVMVLTLVTVGAGAWSLRPAPDLPYATVVFRPGMTPAEVVAAVGSLDGRFIWSDEAVGVVVVDIAPALRWRLYGKGALLVSGGGGPSGCLGWSRV